MSSTSRFEIHVDGKAEVSYAAERAVLEFDVESTTEDKQVSANSKHWQRELAQTDDGHNYDRPVRMKGGRAPKRRTESRNMAEIGGAEEEDEASFDYQPENIKVSMEVSSVFYATV